MPTNFVTGTNNSEIIDAADGVTNHDDYIRAKDGNDTIFGLDGNDSIHGGKGGDYIHGGEGRDGAYYESSIGPVNVNLRQGTADWGEAEGDMLISIENLGGSAYGDILAGNDDPNTILGRQGNDHIHGWGGDDILFGEWEDDVLEGGSGGDHLDGGLGIDTAAYTQSADGVVVSLWGGVTLGSDAGGDAVGDVLWSIENLTGSQHADGLTGNDGDNVLRGLGGKDTLKGFGGSDTLWGGTGSDTLLGWNGDDTLYGEAWDDVLAGGYGLDHLYGGSDADTFMWNKTEETSTSTLVADVIGDFNAMEGDLIALGSIDADVYALGNQSFTFIGAAAFSGAPGELRYYHSSGNTYIEMQTGTSADVEGVIRLDGIHTPAASWFVL
jgi:Ca2+-binding RTX toxin-like protein